MSSPTFNGTNGEAHKTQHITARKVVEVNSFFIPQQLTRTNVRKEEHTPCTGEAFFLPHRHRKTRSASPARGKQSGLSKRGGEPNASPFRYRSIHIPNAKNRPYRFLLRSIYITPICLINKEIPCLPRIRRILCRQPSTTCEGIRQTIPHRKNQHCLSLCRNAPSTRAA